MQVLVTPVPFGETDPRPLELLYAEPGVEVVLNPFGRKLKEEEVANLARMADVLIAGTEPLTKRVFDGAPNLKFVSRVGIGLDSVDLEAARQRGIQVSYTPDAPAPAVAELTIGFMLALCRSIPRADRLIRAGRWNRFVGRRLSDRTIGIIGTGRVGKQVIAHLRSFAPRLILANDTRPDLDFYQTHGVTLASKEEIYRRADLISVHVPLTSATRSMIAEREMAMMKPETLLINTARGGIVDEDALHRALVDEKIAGAALDVYEHEPYLGPLATLEQCIMTCHMGSCTVDCRLDMELRAAEEALRFIRGDRLEGLVPESEY